MEPTEPLQVESKAADQELVIIDAMEAPDIKITQEKLSPEESEEEEKQPATPSGDHAYSQGKLEIIQGVNQTLKIFWEVWRDSLPFKNEIMKIIYMAIN